MVSGPWEFIGYVSPAGSLMFYEFGYAGTEIQLTAPIGFRGLPDWEAIQDWLNQFVHITDDSPIIERKA